MKKKDKERLLKNARHVAWVVLLLIVTWVIFSAINDQKATNIRDIDVNIAPFSAVDSNLIKRQDVLGILSNSFEENILGNQLENINVKRVEQVLEENPFVKNADAFVDAQQILHIDIEQRVPIVRIWDNDGRNYYLDELGTYMPLSKHYTARIPVVTGFIPAHVPDFLERRRYGLKNVFELIEIFRADPFWEALIEQIHVSQNGDILFIPKVGKQQILFGKYLNTDAKLRRLKIFYEQVIPHEGWQKYKLIDIRFEQQVVCKR